VPAVGERNQPHMPRRRNSTTEVLCKDEQDKQSTRPLHGTINLEMHQLTLEYDPERSLSNFLPHLVVNPDDIARTRRMAAR